MEQWSSHIFLSSVSKTVTNRQSELLHHFVSLFKPINARTTNHKQLSLIPHSNSDEMRV